MKENIHGIEEKVHYGEKPMGYIHSLETFGTVDGPGIRYVVFLQGCPMRCKYCHNPDTWECNKGTLMSAEDILKQYDRYRAFLKKGGITATGGEPMMQMDFLIDLFEKAKKKQIHTCIDTSGIVFRKEDIHFMQKLERLIAVTDLVLLDIKHIEEEEHKKLTGFSNKNILEFAKYLEERKIPLWIRHVIVPEITMEEKQLSKLGQFLGGLSNIKALDVLPYHDMGKVKYEKLGLPYPLPHIEPVEKDAAIWARNIIIEAMRKERMHLS